MPILLLGSIALLLPTMLPSGTVAPTGTAVPLEARTFKAGEIFLPAEKFADVAGGIPVRHQKGERFAAAIEGEILRADLDGDGTLDARVEGEEGALTLQGTSPEGHAIRYTARLARFKKGPWKFTCASAMCGSIDGTPIQVIDQNLNGSFDDVGQDAIVVGRDAAASFLSSVVSIDGKLLSVAVARDGSSLSFEPFTGSSGMLDLASSFECKAKLRAAVVKSTDGRLSFNLAKSKGGSKVPAGEYVLSAGQLVLGDSRAQIGTGRAKPIVVSAGALNTVAWGGPVKGEFALQRDGGDIGFTPWDIWYYGKMGEEYAQFLPLGASPEFTVTDKASGKTLATATFPGNCCGFGFKPTAVSVPAHADVAITMKADNWAFGEVEGQPRGQQGVSEQPLGTEKPIGAAGS